MAKEKAKENPIAGLRRQISIRKFGKSRKTYDKIVQLKLTAPDGKLLTTGVMRMEKAGGKLSGKIGQLNGKRPIIRTVRSIISPLNAQDSLLIDGENRTEE